MIWHIRGGKLNITNHKWQILQGVATKCWEISGDCKLRMGKNTKLNEELFLACESNIRINEFEQNLLAY